MNTRKISFVFLILLTIQHVIFAQSENRGFLIQKDTTSSNTNELVNHNPFGYKNKYALLIGINDYEDEKIPKLKFAVNDAVEISKLLVNQLDFDTQHVKLLLDSLATRENILNALQSFINDSSIPENSELVIYFACHGTVSKSGKKGFLLTYDSKEGSELSTAISMDEISRITNECLSKHILLLVDACYGGFANSRAATSALVKNTWGQKARHIITAGNSDEEVIESSDWEHSAFTKVLLDAIAKGEADVNNDNILTSSELYLYLEQRISFYASQKGGKQTPQFGKLSPDGGIFFLELKPNALSNITDNATVQNDDEIEEKLNSTVKIKSNVESARIFLNSIEIGFLNSGNYYLKVKPGFHRIELRLDKYETGIFEGLIAPDSTYNLVIPLERKTSLVSFKVEPNDAAVLLNNNLIGVGSFTVEIPKGRHEVLVEKKGYKPEKNIVNIMTDSTSFNYNITKITAKVEIKSVPSDALVTLNNETLGHTPLTIDLNYGQYNLTFTKKNYLPNQILVDVNDNEIKRFDILLKENPDYVIKNLAKSMRSKKISGFFLNGALAYGSYRLYGFLDTKLTNLPPKDDNADLYKIGKFSSIGLMAIFGVASISNLIKATTINKEKLYRKYLEGQLNVDVSSTLQAPVGVKLSYNLR